MAKRVGVDKWLFFTTLSLVVMGLAMVFSASAVMAQARFGSPYTFLGRQALWALLGVVAMVLLMRVDYRRYKLKKFIYPAMGVTLLFAAGRLRRTGSHATHAGVDRQHRFRRSPRAESKERPRSGFQRWWRDEPGTTKTAAATAASLPWRVDNFLEF